MLPKNPASLELYPVKDRDLVANIELFRDIADIQALDTDLQRKVLAAACKRIKDNLDAQFSSYTDLRHFMHVIDVLGHKLSLIPSEYACTAENIKRLLKKLDAKKSFGDMPENWYASPEADFRQQALAFIKQQERDHTPKELLDCSLYHSTALEEGIKTLLEAAKGLPLDKTLSELTAAYCKDLLQPRQFLLRPSSSALPDEGQPFVFTLSHKGKKRSLLYNRRFVCKEVDDKMKWSTEDGARQYNSLQELIAHFTKAGLTGMPAPCKEKVQAYMAEKYPLGLSQ